MNSNGQFVYNRWKCTDCDYTNGNKFVVINHMATHLEYDQKPYVCPYCIMEGEERPVRSSAKNTMAKHYLTHIDKYPEVEGTGVKDIKEEVSVVDLKGPPHLVKVREIPGQDHVIVEDLTAQDPVWKAQMAAKGSSMPSQSQPLGARQLPIVRPNSDPIRCTKPGCNDREFESMKSYRAHTARHLKGLPIRKDSDSVQSPQALVYVVEESNGNGDEEEDQYYESEYYDMPPLPPPMPPKPPASSSSSAAVSRPSRSELVAKYEESLARFKEAHDLMTVIQERLRVDTEALDAYDAEQLAQEGGGN